MKKFMIPFLLVTGLLIMISGYSQQQGVITYEVKMKIHGLPDDEGQDDQIITGRQELFFSENESLYAPAFDDDEEGFDNGIMTFREKPPQFLIYFNIPERKKIEQTEFMGKKYRITDSLKISSWKLGTGIKKILGYDCKEASFKGDSLHPSLTVWYTGDLRPYLGPENFNTVPGAVLEVIVGDGRRFIAAQQIEFRDLKKNELKVPTGGQLITAPEYDKMVSEEMEKVKRNGGGVMIGG